MRPPVLAFARKHGGKSCANLLEKYDGMLYTPFNGCIKKERKL